MKSKLDVATNVAIIGVCLIAGFVLIRNNFFPPTPPPPPGSVQVGDKIDALAKLVPAGAEKAMVVAIQPTCHFCNESMPFYKQLVDKRNQSGSAVKLIAAVPSPQAKDEEAQHLASAGATMDGVQPVDYRAIKVSGTPTVILVDRQGKVLSVWVGKLEGPGEQEVLKKL
ncbi:MAG TPA: hypothetical protein VGE98_07850 [Thermoanaerobaculia bacterium]